MVPSERTHSVRAIWENEVADYSTPGINSMRCIPYRPLITVSLFLLVLSVSKCKWSHWRWGKLWPYVGMDSLSKRVYRNCNAMGDATKISHVVPSTWAHNAIFSLLIIYIIPSRQIYVAIDNSSLVPSVSCYTTGGYLWNDVRAADNVFHAEIL